MENAGNGYNCDADGNQVSPTGGGGVGTQTRTFDRENRVVKTVAGGTTTRYIYDGNGKRLLKLPGP